MSHSSPDPAGFASPPAVDLSLRDGLPSEQREVAERSIATLVARSAKAVEQARAADAERRKLVEALNAPLAELIAADSAAAQALEKLRGSDLYDVQPVYELSPDAPPMVKDEPVSIVVAPDVGAIEVRGPPYDFDWRWHHEAGSAPGSSFTHARGRVGLDARSGSISGGASGYVEAHAGFGVILRTDHQVNVIARSLRRMTYGYTVGCTGLGGDATSEGGTEFSALENGQFLAGVRAKLWRKRVSGVEYATSESGGAVPIDEPRELGFTMEPGREYTFNVGMWVFSDRTPGVGTAWAQSVLEADVLALTIQRGD